LGSGFWKYVFEKGGRNFMGKEAGTVEVKI
jgi:hypothetical protein